MTRERPNKGLGQQRALAFSQLALARTSSRASSPASAASLPSRFTSPVCSSSLSPPPPGPRLVTSSLSSASAFPRRSRLISSPFLPFASYHWLATCDSPSPACDALSSRAAHACWSHRASSPFSGASSLFNSHTSSPFPPNLRRTPFPLRSPVSRRAFAFSSRSAAERIRADAAGSQPLRRDSAGVNRAEEETTDEPFSCREGSASIERDSWPSGEEETKQRSELSREVRSPHNFSDSVLRDGLERLSIADLFSALGSPGAGGALEGSNFSAHRSHEAKQAALEREDAREADAEANFRETRERHAASPIASGLSISPTAGAFAGFSAETGRGIVIPFWPEETFEGRLQPAKILATEDEPTDADVRTRAQDQWDAYAGEGCVQGDPSPSADGAASPLEPWRSPQTPVAQRHSRPDEEGGGLVAVSSSSASALSSGDAHATPDRRGAGRAETGRPTATRAVRQTSFLFDDEEADDWRLGDAEGTGEAPSAAADSEPRLEASRGGARRRPAPSDSGAQAVGRQRRKGMQSSAATISSVSTSHLGSSFPSSAASSAPAPPFVSRAPEALSPLDMLRLARAEREFEAADHVLRLQALARTSSDALGADEATSAHRAFLWRRATLRLTPEVTATLAPASLLQTLQALARGRGSGLLPPSPALLIQVFNACTEKLMYWSLDDQLLLLRAASSLLLPPAPEVSAAASGGAAAAPLVSSSTSASSSLSPFLASPPSAGWPVAKPDWGGGALGPAAAFTMEVLLQRMQAERENLKVSDIVAVLHVYARLKLLSPSSSLLLLDTLYRKLLESQARQKRLLRVAAAVAQTRWEGSGGAPAGGKRNNEHRDLEEGTASLGRYAGPAQPQPCVASAPSSGGSVCRAASPRRDTQARRESRPSGTSRSLLLSPSLESSLSSLLRLADSVACLLDEGARRCGLSPSEEILGAQLLRRHVHRMQQARKTPAAFSGSASASHAAGEAPGKHAKGLEEESRRSLRLCGPAAQGRGTPDAECEAESEGRRRPDDQAEAEMAQGPSRGVPSHNAEFLALRDSHGTSLASEASGAPTLPRSPQSPRVASPQTQAAAALSPLSLRLMARLFQHLVEGFLASYRLERETLERVDPGAGGGHSGGGAARGIPRRSRAAQSASLHPLHVSRLLHAMTVLDFRACSMYSYAQTVRSRHFFQELFSLLDVDALLAVDGVEGGAAASAAVSVVADLALQKRLYECTQGSFASSAAAQKRGESPSDGAGYSEAVRPAGLAGAGSARDAEKAQAPQQSEAQDVAAEKDVDRKQAEGFFVDSMKDEILPRLVAVALRHARTLSVHQHAALLEALSLHLRYRHDFLLDALRCSALAAASRALGILPSGSSATSRHGVPPASLFMAAWSTMRLFCTLLRQHPLVAFPVVLEGHGVFAAAADVLAAGSLRVSAFSSPSDLGGTPTPRPLGFALPEENSDLARARLLVLLLSSLLPHLRKRHERILPCAAAEAHRLCAPSFPTRSPQSASAMTLEPAGASAECADPLGGQKALQQAMKVSETHGEPYSGERRGASEANQTCGARDRSSSPRLRPLWVYVHPNLSEFNKSPLCFLEGPLRQKAVYLPGLLDAMANDAERVVAAVRGGDTAFKHF
ncbi:hypothetical protein BESB_053600 [Besnoitia besnoiti]|uniref:Uncharacterized protein n=1 Tax=Besnoitia besnoiti TaxID=94643 RepID=A0A2A9MCW1_BESBE|nr:hypothetical protein BESB_053600 [Besnoitia besnoiti]PFH35709.1 hypothetical protein BESB_053600 [Besnoitia besnoiti]